MLKNEKKSSTAPTGKNIGAPLPQAAIPVGWTADGLPVGEPMMERSQWNSGIFSCLGRSDDFCSSDLEVCEYFTFFFCLFLLWILVYSVQDLIFMHWVLDYVMGSLLIWDFYWIWFYLFWCWFFRSLVFAVYLKRKKKNFNKLDDVRSNSWSLPTIFWGWIDNF